MKKLVQNTSKLEEQKYKEYLGKRSQRESTYKKLRDHVINLKKSFVLEREEYTYCQVLSKKNIEFSKSVNKT